MTRKKIGKIDAVQFADCRDLGHAWKPVDAWREGMVFIETLRCSRCNTRKDRAFHAKTGRLLQVKANLRYPAGYLRPKGSGRMDEKSRGEMRLSRLR